MRTLKITAKIKSHINRRLYRLFEYLGRRWFTHVVYSYNGDSVDGVIFATDMNTLVKLRRMKLRPGRAFIRN
jgi:hypothetical protein